MRKIGLMGLLIAAPLLSGCVDEGAVRNACMSLKASYVPPGAAAESLAIVQKRAAVKTQYDAGCSAYGPITGDARGGGAAKR